MTTRPDPSFDQRIADWLERDPSAAPDALLDTVLAALPSVPQRRWGTILGGWRPSAMTPMLKLALGAAAAVVIALAGLYALNPRVSTGPGGQSPTTAASPTPTLTPLPTPFPTSTTISDSRFSIPFSMTVPAGWRVAHDHPDYFAAAQTEADGDPVVGIDLAIVTRTYADPCDPEAGFGFGSRAGVTVNQFVRWFTLLDRYEDGVMINISPAQHPVTVAGYDAIQMNEDFSGTASCPFLALWATEAGPYPIYAPERKQFYVMDVNGQRVIAVIVAQDRSFDAVAGDVLAVLETLEFR